MKKTRPQLSDRERFALIYTKNLLREIHQKRPKLARSLVEIIEMLEPSEMDDFMEFLEVLAQE